MTSKYWHVIRAAGFGAVVGLPCFTADASVKSGSIKPIMPGSAMFNAPAVELSPVERNRMLLLRQQIRDLLVDEAQKTMKRDVGLPAVTVEQTTLSTNSPSNFVIGRNSRNTQANVTGQSTLAEPAAINNNGQVFAAGNFSHAEHSTDHGVTWANITLPGGPARAPLICCDNDVVIDDATKIGLHSVLYVNANLTNGIVRIFIRQKGNLGRAKCFYDIAPEFIHPVGISDDIMPDYPHLGLSENFAYLAINAVPADMVSAHPFARMYRFNLSQMRDCQTTSFSSFDRMSEDEIPLPQRVWVPAGGGEHEARVLWVQHDSTSVMRVFDWPEAARSPTEVTRTLQTTNFSKEPDCRGGVGNFNYMEASIKGFQHRCAIGRGVSQRTGILACYWNAGSDDVYPQALVRSAVFSLDGLSLIAQPHIWNATSCIGYPAVTANVRGDIGLSIAAGGKSGGGGSAVEGYVGIDDQVTAGDGTFGTLFRVAAGVANREDGRFGDYFTIRPYQKCDKWFGATSYAWNHAPVDTAEDVNSRWVEFGRDKYLTCYNNKQ